MRAEFLLHCLRSSNTSSSSSVFNSIFIPVIWSLLDYFALLTALPNFSADSCHDSGLLYCIAIFCRTIQYREHNQLEEETLKRVTISTKICLMDYWFESYNIFYTVINNVYSIYTPPIANGQEHYLSQRYLYLSSQWWGGVRKPVLY